MWVYGSKHTFTKIASSFLSMGVWAWMQFSQRRKTDGSVGIIRGLKIHILILLIPNLQVSYVIH